MVHDLARKKLSLASHIFTPSFFFFLPLLVMLEFHPSLMSFYIPERQEGRGLAPLHHRLWLRHTENVRQQTQNPALCQADRRSILARGCVRSGTLHHCLLEHSRSFQGSFFFFPPTEFQVSPPGSWEPLSWGEILGLVSQLQCWEIKRAQLRQRARR